MSKRDRRERVRSDMGAEYVYDGMNLRLVKGVEGGERDNRDIDAMLDEAERTASEILKPHTIPPDATKHRYCAPIREHDGIFSLRDDAPEAAHYAIEVLHNAELAREHIASGNVRQATLHSLNVGIYHERMRLSHYAPHVGRGRVTLTAAGKGGEASRKIMVEDQYTARNERERLISLGHTKNSACDIVAEQFRVSNKTIWRL